MRTAITRLDIRRTRTLSEALDILASEHRAPIAGATDVYVAVNFGTLAAQRFLDIWHVAELRRIDVRDGKLVIGALATYTDVIRSPAVVSRLPMLVDAARQVGGPQIQNRGTIGGNVANASPAGDSLPVLVAADASIVVRSLAGERRVPITEFFTGYRATVLRPDELIVAIEVPPVQGAQWFRKVGTRAAQAISKIVIAGVRGPSTRVALGSVAPTVVRAHNAERALATRSIDDAAHALMNDIHPIDDLRSTADYRRRVAANLLRRFWRDTA
jgi:CO/xanthine dehydrogenase FAD-binding subunit